jgi:hypothetical protein
VHSWHRDDETEEIVDNCVQKFKGHGFTWHVLYAFHTVVDVELGGHVDEAKGVDAPDHCVQDERVPGLVFLVHH